MDNLFCRRTCKYLISQQINSFFLKKRNIPAQNENRKHVRYKLVDADFAK